MNRSQAATAHPSNGDSTTTTITVDSVSLPSKREVLGLLRKPSYGGTIIQKRAFIVEKVLPQSANLMCMITNFIPELLVDLLTGHLHFYGAN